MSKTKGKTKGQCDRLMSILIRSRGHCELSGLDNIKCNGCLQHMHILTRSNMRLRYEEDNALCGCAAHHIYYTYHPWEFVKLVEQYFPRQHAFVEMHRNEIQRFSLKDLQEKADELQAKLRALQQH